MKRKCKRNQILISVRKKKENLEKSRNILLKGVDELKKENFKDKNIIAVLLLALTGAALLYLSEFIPTGAWKNIIGQISLAILISGILGIINEYMLKDSLVELILEKVKIKENVDKTGLEEIVPDITEINYKYYFKKARKNIDIVHIYGRTWTNNNIDEITERVMNSNCHVRVVLVDPESPFTPALEEHFQYENGQLKTLIADVSKVWKEKHAKKERSKTRKSNQGSIKLYYHKGQPVNSMYRIDDRVIVVQTNTTQEKTTRMPAIIFKDTNKSNCFFNIYKKEIEQLIEESRIVKFEDL
jgi:hypothetical protein